MIFYTGSTLNKEEMGFLDSLQKESEHLELPSWWQMGDTLRFAHTVKFDPAKTKLVVVFKTVNNRVFRVR